MSHDVPLKLTYKLWISSYSIVTFLDCFLEMVVGSLLELLPDVVQVAREFGLIVDLVLYWKDDRMVVFLGHLLNHVFNSALNILW